MGLREAGTAAETKLLDFTALMNREFSQRTAGGGTRKSLQSKTISTGSSKVAKTFRTREARTRKIDAAVRPELPTLNLAKVRRNLAEQAELATAGGAGVLNDDANSPFSEHQKDDMPMAFATANALVSARFGTSVQEYISSKMERSTKAAQWSPRIGCFGDDTTNPISKGKPHGDLIAETCSGTRWTHGGNNNREKITPVRHFGSNPNSQQIVLATCMPSSSSSSGQAHRSRAQPKVLPVTENFHVPSHVQPRKLGSMTCRGMTAPSNSEPGQVLKAAMQRGNVHIGGGSQAAKTESNKIEQARKLETSEGDQSTKSMMDLMGQQWGAEPKKKHLQQGKTSNLQQPGSRGLMSVGSLSARGPTSEKMQLEEKIKLKLKSVSSRYNQMADMNVESEAICHRQFFPHHLFCIILSNNIVLSAGLRFLTVCEPLLRFTSLMIGSHVEDATSGANQ